jgi:hypothetical protein
MTPDEPLAPAKAEDIADALAFALRYSGRKRVQDSADIMAAIVARRLVEHLERCGFVVMRKPPIPGSAAPLGLAPPSSGA